MTTRSLYHIQGNDVGGENQDVFVVALNPTEAVELWNQWCVENEFSRDDDDEYEEDRIVGPKRVREILEDVAGTRFNTGRSGYIEWEQMRQVSW